MSWFINAQQLGIGWLSSFTPFMWRFLTYFTALLIFAVWCWQYQALSSCNYRIMSCFVPMIFTSSYFLKTGARGVKIYSTQQFLNLLHLFWNHCWSLQSDWLSQVQFNHKSHHFFALDYFFTSTQLIIFRGLFNATNQIAREKTNFCNFLQTSSVLDQ